MIARLFHQKNVAPTTPALFSVGDRVRVTSKHDYYDAFVIDRRETWRCVHCHAHAHDPLVTAGTPGYEKATEYVVSINRFDAGGSLIWADDRVLGLLPPAPQPSELERIRAEWITNPKYSLGASAAMALGVDLSILFAEIERLGGGAPS